MHFKFVPAVGPNGKTGNFYGPGKLWVSLASTRRGTLRFDPNTQGPSVDFIAEKK